MLLTLLYSLSGTKTVSTGPVVTGHQGGRCSQHLKSSGLPLNSMECEKFPIRSIWVAVAGTDTISTRTSSAKGAHRSWLLVSRDHNESREARESQELRLRSGTERTIETKNRKSLPLRRCC